MSLFNRRQALVSAGGAVLTSCDRRKTYFPPNASVLLGMSFATTDTLTLASQRLLLTNQSMAREMPESMISPHFPVIGEADPGVKNSAYRADQLRGFPAFRLPVTGLVAQPLSLALGELRSMSAYSQVTQHSCERGWSAIAKWTGVRLADVLARAGLKPEARWVMFQSVDGWWDSLDLFDALHPQTLLAYGMNDDALPVPHGAPVRLRVERALGWKSMKFITSIKVLDRVERMPDGKSSLVNFAGLSWYAGI